MTQLVAPSRRGFLGLGLGLVCAPAIIRVTSLMPIKVWETYGPGGLLTAEMINIEVSRLLRATGRNKNRLLNPEPVLVGSSTNLGPVKQSYVMYEHQTEDRKLSLEKYSERILSPAVACLRSKARVVISCQDQFEQLKGVYEFARADNVRTVTDYNIITDSFLTRLDIRHL